MRAPSRIHVIFTTRHGGASQPPYQSLNLAFHVDDLINDVTQNRAILAGAFGLDPSLITCTRQQHTALVKELSDKNEVGSGAFGEESSFDPCDGLITSLKSSPILLHFADCAPVVLCATDGVGKPVLAVVHAGRRGLVGGIIKNGVDAMTHIYNVTPGSIVAAVGPAIGSCCYQVDEGIASRFESRFGSKVVARNDEDVRLDIQSAAEVALKKAGLVPENIYILKICTSCDGNFFSYRRDGVTGRHGAIAWIE